jgi:hypothetical protein
MFLVSRLAFRAEMGGTAAEDDSLNRGFAGSTRLGFSRIDAMKDLKATAFSVCVAIVAKRTALVAQRPSQG